MMVKAATVIGIVLLGGCGDEAAVCSRDGGAACFELPTEPMRTYEMGGNSDVPQIGCGDIVPTSSTMAVTLRGDIADYNSAQPVAGATLEVFGTADYQNAIGSATTDTTGAYSINLASGTPDLLWGKIMGGGVAAQLLHQMRPDLDQPTLDVDHTTSTSEFLDMAAQMVDVDRDDSRAQLVVHVLDCNRHSIMRTVVVLSATAGVRDFVEGAPVFYSVVGSFPIPASRDQITVTGPDGSAVVLNVPVDGGELYVQAWGFPDAAAVARGEDGLVLIAEHAAARRTGTSTRVNLWANQD